MTLVLFPFVLFAQKLMTGQFDFATSGIISIAFGFILPFIWARELKDSKQRYFKLTDFPFPLEDQEEVLVKDFATYLLSVIDVEGVLFISNRRLAFDPFKYRIVKNGFEIRLEDIASIHTYKIFGISDTGVKIKLKSGEVRKFAAESNEEHVEKVKKMIWGSR